MDTKLKKSNKIKINIIFTIITLIVSTLIFSMNPYFRNIMANNTSDRHIYDDYIILETLINTNNVLYKDVLEYENNGPVDVTDALIDKSNIPDYLETPEYYNKLKSIFNDYQNTFFSEYSNIKYELLYKDGSVIKSNDDNLLEQINRNDFDFFVDLNFDKDGFITINNSRNLGTDSIRDLSSSFNRTIPINGNTRLPVINVKNCRIIYAIPNELTKVDSLSKLKESKENSYDYSIIAPFICMLALTIFIVLLIIPYRVLIKINLAETITKIPLEILLLLYGFIIPIGIMLTCMLIGSTVSNQMFEFLSTIISASYTIDSIIFITNILELSIVIYILATLVVVLKKIFNIGIKSYLKSNTILYKLYNFIKIQFIGTFLKIDFSDKKNTNIIKFLLFNLVIISFFSLGWLFGILGPFIYSFILLKLTLKYKDKVYNDYSKLIELIKEIENGNVNVTTDDDFGMFNEIKDSVLNIKAGLKKAVDEEVKSQKMKTELISNVSHDLKTPLTSIITYIDLLKNDSITEEDRISYIETIDKKSQRLKFLIEDLFEVSKANSGNITLNIVNVDIVELVKQTLIECNNNLADSNLNIITNYPQSENKILLKLDSSKTFRIFENLLNNVSKYSMKNSRVYINIDEDNSFVNIIIKNISSNQITFTEDEISERFVRGDKSRNSEGSGLGLAIVKSFTEAQGGKFKIEIDGDLFKAIVSFKK